MRLSQSVHAIRVHAAACKVQSHNSTTRSLESLDTAGTAGACVVGEQWRIAEVARTYVLARGQRERALGTVGEPVAAVSCSQSSERTPPRLS